MAYFSEAPQYVGDTATAEHAGFELVASMEHDSDISAPWEEHDGHGEVSGWTRRAKLPGELVLCEDRDSKRFYDFAGACRIARRDGWNAAPYDVPGETARQRATKAARADFDRLRAWCNDDWHWCGLVVVVKRDGIELGRSSIWGTESDRGEHLVTLVNECAEEALSEAREALAGLCQCEEA